MSNALPILLADANTATRPGATEIGDLSPMMTSMCGIGLCVLATWVALSAIKRDKIGLRRSPGRSNNLTGVHILAAFIGWLLLPSLLIDGIKHSTALSKSQLGVLAGIVHNLAAVGVGLVLGHICFVGGAFRGMGFTLRRWINDSVRSVATLMAVLPVCVALLILTQWAILLWSPEPIKGHQMLTMIVAPQTTVLWRYLIVLSVVVMAPLGEEILFRGLLQSMLRDRLKRPWAAIVLTSVLFAAVHFPVAESLPALFALSVALGYSYERTGRLYAPIMIHLLFNLTMITDRLMHSPG